MIKISIIAFHYSDSSTLEQFLEKTKLFDEIFIIDSTKEQNNKNFTFENVNYFDFREINDIEHIKEKITNSHFIELETTSFFSKKMLDEILLLDINVEYSYKIKREFYFLNDKIKFKCLENTLLFILPNSSLKRTKIVELNEIMNEGLDIDLDLFDLIITNRTMYFAYSAYKTGKKPTIFHLLVIPFLYFIYHYFFRFVFLNGKKGYVYLYMQTFGIVKKYLQTWLFFNKLN